MVFAGEFAEDASGRGLSDGFRDLGWLVQEVDQRDFGVRPGGGLSLRVLARLTRSTSAEAYRERLLAACRTLRPDVFLVIKGIGITAELLRQVRELGARIVMYYPDVAFDHHGVSVESFAGYDLFVTTKTFQLAHLEASLGAGRVAHVPHGYVAGVHRPVFARLDEADHQVDVLHAGNHSAYKQGWIEAAVSALPDVTFRIVGNRWRENAGPDAAARCDLPGARIGIVYAEAIQAARINVAIHMGTTSTDWRDLVSTRTFEIPACRGFMLHIDNDEVREYFTPGVEIDVFSTPQELADKIRFYLARPELRAQMVERAYARAVPAYSYHARAAAVDALMAERLSISKER